MQRLFLTRRRFLGTSAAGFASVTIVPRCTVAASGQTSPNEKLNIAGIGVGGQGAADMGQFSGENIVAICDVDTKRAEGTLQKFPKAKTFRDFRKMFDAVEKQVDAVLVATPDHTHAVAAMAAIRRGKHVYCEKPLAHSVYEVRQLMKAAAEHKVVTQLGNQGHSTDSIRTFCEWISDGAIGNVHTIHAGCSAQNPGSATSRVWRTRRRCPRISTGICGWAPRRSGHTTVSTCRALGGAGYRSATGRWATGHATSSIPSFGHWIWERRKRSKPR